MVGSRIAKDLADSFAVTAVDRSESRLREAFQDFPTIETLDADLAGGVDIGRLVDPFDLVVGAVPGSLGNRLLEASIRAGKDVVDIAFSPEDPLALHDLAIGRGVTAVIDMGLAPGMSNAILGHHVASMARVEYFDCMVGGLPVERYWPFEYRAPFSPADVIEEYSRPARLVEGGKTVVRPALSGAELVDVPGIGTLEAFLTDGLRTLLQSYDVPCMRERTLRYPGHARLMQALRDSGFFSSSPIHIGDVEVAPLEVTSRLLFPVWKLEEGDPEFTVMKVVVGGESAEGQDQIWTWWLNDRPDPRMGVSSMARTTGFACSAAVHLLLEGRLPGPGVVPPERVGEDPDCFRFLLDYQAERGVVYRSSAL